MKFRYIFAYKMYKIWHTFWVIYCCKIIYQGVKPNVNCLFRVIWNLYTPRNTGLWARNWEVGSWGLKLVQNFVADLGGKNGFLGPSSDFGQDFILKLENIVVLLNSLNFFAQLSKKFSIFLLQIFFHNKTFLINRIIPRMFPTFDISLRFQLFPEHLHSIFMVWFGGSYKPVIFYISFFKQFFELIWVLSAKI